MWKPTICPAAGKSLHQAIRKTENESAVSLLLLWETNRGKYVFFGVIIRFVTFQSPLRLPSNLDCPKTCLWVTRCYSRNFRGVETASTLLYAQETTNAQLRSHSCFPDRLLILNEDRILSDDYKKGFRKTLLIFHYFPILNRDILRGTQAVSRVYLHAARGLAKWGLKMKALYPRYCFGKIIEGSMYSLA